MEALNQFFQEVFAQWHSSDAFVSSCVLVVSGIVIHLVLRVVVNQLHRAARHSKNSWDDVVVTALEVPLRVALWVVVCYMLLEINSLAESWRKVVIQAYDTALVLMLAWFLYRLIKGGEQQVLYASGQERASYDKATVQAIAKLLRIILWVLTGMMVMQSLGISISGLLAFGGIGGIAVGFAAKDLLANFLGALGIFLDRPFASGDWIRSPDRDIEGVVEDIGWRLTRIRTFDQRPLYVPNAVFSQIAVENPSRMTNRRIYETIGLRYCDVDQMGAVVSDVEAMLKNHPAIDTNHTLMVNFVTFADSSLNFFIYTFTKTTVWAEYHAIKQEIMLKIVEIVHSHGADFAFPTQSLYIEQDTPPPAVVPEPEPGMTATAGNVEEPAVPESGPGPKQGPKQAPKQDSAGVAAANAATPAPDGGKPA